jgi:hypothetical protein
MVFDLEYESPTFLAVRTSPIEPLSPGVDLSVGLLTLRDNAGALPEVDLALPIPVIGKHLVMIPRAGGSAWFGSGEEPRFGYNGGLALVIRPALVFAIRLDASVHYLKPMEPGRRYQSFQPGVGATIGIVIIGNGGAS